MSKDNENSTRKEYRNQQVASSRIRQKVEHDEALNKTLTESFSNIISEGKQEIKYDPERSGLLNACQLVATRTKIALKDPQDIEDMPLGKQVLEVARVSHVRVREIQLKDSWWTNAYGSFVASDTDGRPLALIQLNDGEYKAIDTDHKREFTVNRQTASRISDYGFFFFKPFPSSRVGIKRILEISLPTIRKDIVRLALFGALVGVLSMSIPIATGILFNDIIPSANYTLLIQLSLGILLAGIGTAVFQITRSWTMVRIEGKMELSIQSAVWDRLLELPVPFFRKFSTGDLAIRALSINIIRQQISGTIISAVLSSIFSVFNLILLFYFSITLALLAIILVAATLIFMFWFNYRSLGLARKIEQITGELVGTAFEIIYGISKVKSTGSEMRMLNHWGKGYREQMHLEKKSLYNRSIIQLVDSNLPLVFTILLFALVGSGVTGITTGTFIAFSAAFGTFLSSSIALVEAMMSVLRIVPVYERTKPILETEPEVSVNKNHPGKLEGEIEVNHVKFKYDAEGPLIINDVSFRINSGEYIAFVGSSGSGKSTILRLLLGFEKPMSGSIYYDRQDLSTLDLKEVRKQLGVVLQNGQLMAGSIFDNIVGSGNFSLDDAWHAATLAALDKDISRFTMGMHTMISEGSGTLSGGQRQRLMIARALVHKPKIIFFDEATSALDNITQGTVSQTLDSLGITRVVIAHRLSTIRNVDRVYVLDKGRIIQQGGVEELMKKKGPFQELAKRQIA